MRAPDQHIYSDASGSFGCGALWGVLMVQFRWPAMYSDQAIAVKELAAYRNGSCNLGEVVGKASGASTLRQSSGRGDC